MSGTPTSDPDATLRAFTEEHRLRTRRDEDNTLIAYGRRAKSRPGIHRISDYGHRRRLLFSVHNSGDLDPEYRLSGQGWTWIKKRCLGAGMEIHQDGDAEGSFLFDPADPVQAERAIEESGAQKRAVSEATREAARKNIRKAHAAHPHISS